MAKAKAETKAAETKSKKQRKPPAPLEGPALQARKAYLKKVFLTWNASSTSKQFVKEMGEDPNSDEVVRKWSQKIMQLRKKGLALKPMRARVADSQEVIDEINDLLNDD